MTVLRAFRVCSSLAFALWDTGTVFTSVCVSLCFCLLSQHFCLNRPVSLFEILAYLLSLKLTFNNRWPSHLFARTPTRTVVFVQNAFAICLEESWLTASFSTHHLFIRTRMIGNRKTKELEPISGWNRDRAGLQWNQWNQWSGMTPQLVCACVCVCINTHTLSECVPKVGNKKIHDWYCYPKTSCFFIN